jgi:hypothetical protein
VTSRKAEQLMVETWEMVMSKSYTNLSMLPRLVVILPKFVEFCVPLSMSIRDSCVSRALLNVRVVLYNGRRQSAHAVYYVVRNLGTSAVL